METLLEQQRRYHEERERLIDAMFKENLFTRKTLREEINSDHRLKYLLDRYQECTDHLHELYQDDDGLRKEEMNALSGPNEFGEFYSRLKQLREFHRKHPNEISVPMSVEFDELTKEREPTELASEVLIDFTDEEGYGRFLDMHQLYEKYINLKGVERVDYYTYLSVFDQLSDIPREKKNSAYKDYLSSLLEYLEAYIKRVKPLYDINGHLEKINQSFEDAWASGNAPGWRKETTSALAHTGAHLDLSSFNSWQELASLGLDRLKSALMALGLKCGGTVEERAKRLFQTKGKQLSELDPALFAKKRSTPSGGVGGKKGSGGTTETATSTARQFTDLQKHTAFLEAQVSSLAEILTSQRAATRENIQRKQARTAGEIESDDEMEEIDSDPEDAEEAPYNPKNLPLGWDGKPIPYWLYKLHGLNMYYSCEICGNQKYRGPKMFQKHFSEWKHAHGMRCLGIPNTAHFANVTSIEDALALWEKIKSTKEMERWKPEQEEEFEDSAGNVVNMKTYEDLKRQGLL